MGNAFFFAHHTIRHKFIKRHLYYYSAIFGSGLQEKFKVSMLKFFFFVKLFRTYAHLYYNMLLGGILL
jgi:hypothetical protein